MENTSFTNICYKRSWAVHDSDSFGAVRYIACSTKDVNKSLQEFLAFYSNEIPEIAKAALSEFINSDWVVDDPRQYKTETILSVSKLIMFCAKFEYLICDTEIDSRNRTERAFEHLKRLIAIDGDTSQKWKKSI
jgi:hypothetical protein